MQASPLRTLLSRRLCCCQPSHLPHHPSSIGRLLSTSTKSNASQTATPLPSYGSSELLKRRYQKRTAPQDDAKTERAQIIKRMKLSGLGIAFCTLAIFGTIALYPQEGQKKLGTEKTGVVQLDAPPSIAGTVEIPKDDEGETVPTGTSTVPTFPKIIHISTDAPSFTPAAANEGTQKDVEYQLVGLGIRTVSFLSIQVYVVGLYIAVSDIAALQEKLVHSVADPVATTLVPGEKGQLRDFLLDPDHGEEIWNAIIKDGQIRTAFRIVPTRQTDFMHLRDGFVRGITARSSHFATDKQDLSFQDESFGGALNDFKQAFGGGARKRLAKGETLLLARDAQGKMTVWEEDLKGVRFKMGEVLDERVGRLLWLNYLAGKKVASEPARQSVIDGVMEYVERPVGTVATQVL
ncbi:Altered inheritance of mitochondria protein 18 mitochondrial [Elasticomyces elasticus]|uniref:Altered inheritance of mitochondria protein 18 mitochondrial n=1 Tax=Exophiala sideris TaxID=1016849 RepID=A0ABR0J7Y6_9EURO|nr:Altered inheritance of mitochondria protein 18 mitochondrial [Elasticomyces elasticus]KAK5029862.1 Altered inheritance of mitochondria protein 18 mitochondrial [Exophiala sideris]KAK5031699.1 Altered inheritance of mitochondria protein 18 mitochondrial [Exophiala sideris]KAK5058377.1 Altered inheritance of mitochondria protein 18 mitochondrial [Exophiala sideris]KAK5180306.1 Altered inheritance of mitochondria protein 18 mitochondrial [Eurotiomycetes sp. CCFEE 6388]